MKTQRICMPSWRNFNKMAFHGGLYEAQDVLLEIDNVDLICPEPNRGFRFKERWQRKFLWKDITKRLISLNPGLQAIRLKQYYELFVFVCQSWWDMLYLSAIKGWKDNCKTSVCYIDEIWADEVPRYKYWLHILAEFDHVVIGLNGSVDAVSDAIGHQCHYVPGAVDAIRFSPYPNPLIRPIDVYSIGRKWEGVHRALLKLAGKKEIFYVFDTLNSADCEMADHRQHRDFLANMAQRSRYFMVGPAKMGVPLDTADQIEFGYRYFEGSAAGTVMIGQAPNSESFRKLFSWPDMVIEIRPDGSDIVDILANLANQTDRLQMIGRRNAKEGLLRHDWVYRWKQIYEIAGLKQTPGMVAREQKLQELSKMADEPYPNEL